MYVIKHSVFSSDHKRLWSECHVFMDKENAKKYIDYVSNQIENIKEFSYEEIVPGQKQSLLALNKHIKWLIEYSKEIKNNKLNFDIQVVVSQMETLLGRHVDSWQGFNI